ncbi:MAG: hypothetical protein KF878_29515, partial [Planctomycetes bacterium]|nr:hypothetical protein [Planctomycetota bacterium]
ADARRAFEHELQRLREERRRLEDERRRLEDERRRLDDERRAAAQPTAPRAGVIVPDGGTAPGRPRFGR